VTELIPDSFQSEAWMRNREVQGGAYVPGGGESAFFKRHRLHDTLSSRLGGSTTPAQMLGVSEF